MKSLFLIRSLDYGGAQRQLVTLCNELGRRGHTITIAVFYAGGDLESEVESQQVRVCALGKQSRWHVFPFIWRLLQLVRSERPDIIHGYLPSGNILATVARAIYPRAILFWGVRASDMKLQNYDYLERIISWIEELLAPVADCIVVNSRSGIHHLATRGFPQSTMVHIPNGIDAGRFRPDSASGLCMRREIGIGTSTKLVGLIGRLDPMKDHATFLSAAALVSQDHPDARFICIGDGPSQFRFELQNLSHRLGIDNKVMWLNARRDMIGVYNALDVVCSSSAYGEGFPNVIGEAMACGRQCVVTDVGDSGFVVGDAALVAPPRNPQALAKIISQELGSCSTSLRSRTRILDNFTIARLADRTEGVFRLQWAGNRTRLLMN